MRKNESNILFLFEVILIVLTLIFLALAMSSVSGEEINVDDTETISITQGDTIWNIARTNSDTDNISIRKKVYIIREINDLDCVLLQPGDTIEIPKKF